MGTPMAKELGIRGVKPSEVYVDIRMHKRKQIITPHVGWLQSSIAIHGLCDPITVFEINDHPEKGQVLALVDGFHRWKAIARYNRDGTEKPRTRQRIEEIPAVVYQGTYAEALTEGYKGLIGPTEKWGCTETAWRAILDPETDGIRELSYAKIAEIFHIHKQTVAKMFIVIKYHGARVLGTPGSELERGIKKLNSEEYCDQTWHIARAVLKTRTPDHMRITKVIKTNSEFVTNKLRGKKQGEERFAKQVEKGMSDSDMHYQVEVLKAQLDGFAKHGVYPLKRD